MVFSSLSCINRSSVRKRSHFCCREMFMALRIRVLGGWDRRWVLVWDYGLRRRSRGAALLTDLRSFPICSPSLFCLLHSCGLQMVFYTFIKSDMSCLRGLEQSLSFGFLWEDPFVPHIIIFFLNKKFLLDWTTFSIRGKEIGEGESKIKFLLLLFWCWNKQWFFWVVNGTPGMVQEPRAPWTYRVCIASSTFAMWSFLFLRAGSWTTLPYLLGYRLPAVL